MHRADQKLLASTGASTHVRRTNDQDAEGTAIRCQASTGRCCMRLRPLAAERIPATSTMPPARSLFLSGSQLVEEIRLDLSARIALVGEVEPDAMVLQQRRHLCTAAARQGKAVREQFSAGDDARNVSGRAAHRLGAVEGRILECREAGQAVDQTRRQTGPRRALDARYPRRLPGIRSARILAVSASTYELASPPKISSWAASGSTGPERPSAPKVSIGPERFRAPQWCSRPRPDNSQN